MTSQPPPRLAAAANSTSTSRSSWHLIDLAAQLKQAKAAGTGGPPADRPEHRAGLREELHPHPLRVRGRRARPGRRTHLPRPGRLTLGREESIADTARVLGRHVRRHRVPRLRTGHRRTTRRARRGAGLERAHRPVAPDPDARRRPHHDRAPRRQPRRRTSPTASPATAATTSPARCWSPARCSAWTSASPRPPSLQPPADVVAAAARIAAQRSGARIHVTDDVHEAVRGADFIYTDVWVSMGESDDEWAARVPMLLPYRVTGQLVDASGQPGTQVHALPAGACTTRTPCSAPGCTNASGSTAPRSPTRSSSPTARSCSTSRRTGCTPSRRCSSRRWRAEPCASWSPSAATHCCNAASHPTRPSSAGTSGSAARALAPLAAEHQLIVCHGNGPQVGVLALESAADPALHAPRTRSTSLGAQTQGMIGYWLAQELHNAGIARRRSPRCVTQTVVDAADPAFAAPTKFIGPVYDQPQAGTLASRYGWTVARRRRRLAAGRPLTPNPSGSSRSTAIRLLVEQRHASSSAAAVAAPGRSRPTTARSPGSRPSSTRTSPRRCWPYTSTPTGC